MKKILLLITVIFIMAAAANAQSKFGLGIIIGEPTGISGKLFLSNNSAVDGAVAWSFGPYSAMHIHDDYLHHMDLFNSDIVPFYVGIGGRIKFKNSDDKNSDSRIGVRIPVGIAIQPRNAPIDIFIEIAPILDLTPDTDFTLNGALGLRYYFN